ncbi:hypothetical protein IAD21_04091 [Abditibacteriota bacterium]|nr:hypothetical protein IAD21_04091 [Abditibacteriota bacterium]
MDKPQFWRLIEASSNKTRNCDKQVAKLEKLLDKLSAEEILGFENIFTSLMRDSYRWDLWAVAYIVGGGCLDDGFEYFRHWLIAQGQTYFEAALQNPERAADAARCEEAECEAIRYATREPYEAKTGIDICEVADAPDYAEEPVGQPWSEEDLEVLFPRLCKKFG